MWHGALQTLGRVRRFAQLKREMMSAFTDHKDELEHYEQMFGKNADGWR